MTIIEKVVGRFEVFRLTFNEAHQQGKFKHLHGYKLREKLAFLEGAMIALKQSESPEWSVPKGRTPLMDKLNLKETKNES